MGRFSMKKKKKITVSVYRNEFKGPSGPSTNSVETRDGVKDDFGEPTQTFRVDTSTSTQTSPKRLEPSRRPETSEGGVEGSPR